MPFSRRMSRKVDLKNWFCHFFALFWYGNFYLSQKIGQKKTILPFFNAIFHFLSKNWPEKEDFFNFPRAIDLRTIILPYFSIEFFIFSRKIAHEKIILPFLCDFLIFTQELTSKNFSGIFLLFFEATFQFISKNNAGKNYFAIF